MKLYTTSGAVNPERVHSFLKEKGQFDALEKIELNLLEGEHKKPEYRQVNPMGKVPALVLDDGTVLSESRAICTYLESVFPEHNLMGTTPLEIAQIEMWDRRIEMSLMMSIAGWFRHGHPRAAALEPIQVKEWSELSEKGTYKSADFFDRVLGETEFVAGDRFTNADITLWTCMGFGMYMKFKAWDGRENISRWRDAMKSRAMAAA